MQTTEDASAPVVDYNTKINFTYKQFEHQHKGLSLFHEHRAASPLTAILSQPGRPNYGAISPSTQRRAGCSIDEANLVWPRLRL